MTRIKAAKSDQIAYFVKGRIIGTDGKKNGYKCFPISCNDASMAQNFETEDAACEFLKANPSWGIRMKPGSAIVYELLIDGTAR